MMADSARGRSTTGGAPVQYHSTTQINRDASPSRGTRRTITIKIASASKVVNPVERTPLAEPVLHLGLGKLSKSINLSKVDAKDRFSLGDIVHMPYNGESILRVMLSDGVFQVGWADVPVGMSAFANSTEIPVDIKSRTDPHVSCGNVVLQLNRSAAKVQPDVAVERTPLSSGGAKTPPVSPPPHHDAGGSTAPVSPIVPNLSHYKSMRVHVMTLRELICAGQPCKKPYVVLQPGNAPTPSDKEGGAVRGPSVTADKDGDAIYEQIFHAPYDGSRKNLKLVCYEDKGPNAKHPLVGTAKMSVGEKDSYLEDRVMLVAEDGHSCGGLVDLQVNSSTKPVTSSRCVPYEAPEPTPDARSEEDDRRHDHKPVMPSGPINPPSIRFRIDRHFQNAPNAFVKAKVGKEELRVTQFGDLQGDEMCFPISNEKTIHFTSQLQKGGARDPVTGVGELDLNKLFSQGREVMPAVVKMKNPDTGAQVGEIETTIYASNDKLGKPKTNWGASVLGKTELPDSFKAPKSVEITVVKVVDPPNCTPGHEFNIDCEFGPNSWRAAPPSVVAASGEIIFNQSYLVPYAKKQWTKISLVDTQSAFTVGHAYVDMDKMLTHPEQSPIKAKLSNRAGTMVIEVAPLDRKLQAARFVPSASAKMLRSCNSLEVKAIAAYDLVHDSKQNAIDPCCELQHGPHVKIEGKPRKEAGVNPILMNTFTVPFEPGEPVVIRILDKAGRQKDPEIGRGSIDVLKDHGQQQVVVLMKDGEPAGTVLCTVRASTDDVKKANVVLDNIDEYKGMQSTDLLKFSEAKNEVLWQGLYVTVHGAKDVGSSSGTSSVEPHLTVHNGRSQASAPHPLKSSNLKNLPINQTFAVPKSMHRIMRFDLSDSKTKKLLGTGNYDLAELSHKIRAVKSAEQKAGITSSALTEMYSTKELKLQDGSGKKAGTMWVTVSHTDDHINDVRYIENVAEAPVVHLQTPTCLPTASSCRVRLTNAEDIPVNASAPYVRLDWFKKSTKTRPLPAGSGKRTFQDDMLIPCTPAQRECTFTLMDKGTLGFDSTLGLATVKDLDTILADPNKPTERWLEFRDPKSHAEVGRVKASFHPSVFKQDMLRTVVSAKSISTGTYKSVKLTVVKTLRLGLPHGKRYSDFFILARHSRAHLKGTLLKDVPGSEAEVMETYHMPLDAEHQVHVVVVDNDTTYGDTPVGMAKLSLLDVGVEQPESGVRREAPILLHGQYNGYIDYVMALSRDPAPADGKVLKSTTAIPQFLEEDLPQSFKSPRATVGPSSSSNMPLYKSLDLEVVKLQDVPTKGPVDPCVTMIMGSQKIKGRNLGSTTTGGCVVGELYKMPVEPVEFIKFEINDALNKKDPLLSSAKLSLATIVNSDKYNEVQRLKLPLFKNDGSSGGNLFMKVKGHPKTVYALPTVEPVSNPELMSGTSTPHPHPVSPLKHTESDASSHGATKIAQYKGDCKSMQIEVLNACSLHSSVRNPYITGRLGQTTLLTHTVDGNLTPDFGDKFFYPYSGQKKLKLSVFDTANNEEVGYCKMDLEQLFEPEAKKSVSHHLTGSLVSKKTGELTSGEVTVVVTPQKTDIAQAYTVKPDSACAGKEDEVAKLPSPCLTLNDLKVTGLDKTAHAVATAGGVGSRMSPYVVTKLGKAKLRTDKPSSPAGAVAQFNDVIELNTSSAPKIAEFTCLNHVQYNVDKPLGTGRLSLLDLKGTDGVFSVPLNDPVTGRSSGATLSGAFKWSSKALKKHGCCTSAKSSHANMEQLKPTRPSTAATSPKATTGEQPASYEIYVSHTTIPTTTKPYIEMMMDDGKKYKLEHALVDRGESVTIPATSVNRTVHVDIKDAKKLGDAACMSGKLDLNDVLTNQTKTETVSCSGKGGYHELEVKITGSREGKPTSLPPVVMKEHKSLGEYKTIRLAFMTLKGSEVKKDAVVKIAYALHEQKTEVYTKVASEQPINTCFTMPVGKDEHLCVVQLLSAPSTVIATAELDFRDAFKAGGKHPFSLTLLDAKKKSAGVLRGTVSLEDDHHPTKTSKVTSPVHK